MLKLLEKVLQGVDSRVLYVIEVFVCGLVSLAINLVLKNYFATEGSAAADSIFEMMVIGGWIMNVILLNAIRNFQEIEGEI